MNVVIIFLLIILTGMPGVINAADTRIGIVKNVRGSAYIERSYETIPVKAGERLFEKDIIITQKDGSLGLILRDNSLLSIGPSSRVVLSEFRFEPAENNHSFLTRIKKGTLTYLTGLMAKMNPNAVKIETPSAVCGVRGTHIAIKVDED